MNGAELGGEPITPDGIAALRAEIEQLEGDARTEMAARIKVARELGDLKENADYHMAKEDQAHLETRIKRLKQRLRNAVVVDVDGRQRLCLRPHRRGPRRGQRRGEHLDPGRLDRG